MSWIELELRAERDAAAQIEAALERAGALAVTIDDGDDDPDEQQPLLEPAPGETPLWRALRITALFNDDPTGTLQAEGAAQTLATECLAPPRLQRLEDRDWERVWLDDLAPMRFGGRLWVCPHEQQPEADDAVCVVLDPGLAFGTGHHPTTALCLEWLDATPLVGCSVLDYGCGSGILAVAALKLGAARALAIDHDPQALDATRENAAANGVSERLSAQSPEPPPDGAAEVVVANILARPLIELAPVLAAASAPGARIALSGILSHQVDAVTAAYAGAFALDEPRQRDDWVLLSGRRRSAGG
jgi:ribosomal protein L11 methyltransferase